MISLNKNIVLKKSNNGTVLIMVMWLLAILSLFAVGLGYRSTIELRLTSYYIDKTKCRYLAYQIINKVFFNIANDQDRKVDAYNESWGNLPESFFESAFEGAKVSAEHIADGNDDNEVTLYGASDECGKINLGKMPTAILVSEYWKKNFSFDEDLVKAITNWTTKKSTEDEMDSWYETTYGYKSRHGDMELIEELHFLKDFASQSSEKNKNRAKLKNIITVWGNGQVNMNTASKEVLEALFVMQSDQKEMERGERDDLIRMIIEYRNGDDGLPGTQDDNLFKDINIETAIGTHESSKISMLNWLRQKKLIGVTSDFFRIDATVSLDDKNFKKKVSAIVTRSKDLARKKSEELKKASTVKVLDAKPPEGLDTMRILQYKEE